MPKEKTEQPVGGDRAKDIRMKQERFVHEYLKDFNGTQAAIRAGYSEKTAGQMAYELLKKPEVQKLLKDFQVRAAEQTQTDINWVRERLKREAELEGEESTQSARVRAIELIAKLNGNFELDNRQKTDPLRELIADLSGSVLSPKSIDLGEEDEE